MKRRLYCSFIIMLCGEDRGVGGLNKDETGAAAEQFAIHTDFLHMNRHCIAVLYIRTILY